MSMYLYFVAQIMSFPSNNSIGHSVYSLNIGIYWGLVQFERNDVHSLHKW